MELFNELEQNENKLLYINNNLEKEIEQLQNIYDKERLSLYQREKDSIKEIEDKYKNIIGNLKINKEKIIL